MGKANLKTAWIVAGRAWVVEHRLSLAVILAQAGIHNHDGRNRAGASAGMDSRLCGNDGGEA
jgi:hypothetical protein